VRALLPLLVLLAVSCGPDGGAAAGFKATPLLADVASASGALHLAVFTDPQPPTRGVVAVRYRITDAAGAPVDGLSVTVVPFMPAMGHGTSVVPTVTPRGAGVYDVANVSLFMAGWWQLRTELQGGASDHADADLQVP
jgi:hypothetical protein